jgi:PAS domain S-box-containing protein
MLLPATESLSETVIQSSLDGFAVMDRETRYTLWNQAMERFAGKTAAEVLGRKAFEVFPFLRDHGLDVAFERVLAGETIATEGVEHVEPDGSRKVYDRLYVPLRAGGEIAGVIAIVRDATARYAALDALRRSEANLRLAAEAASVGFWSWNLATDAVTWEDAICAIFGLPPGQPPAGREAYLALVHADDRARVAERIARGTPEGGWEDEFRIVRTDGAVRWIATKARVVRVEGADMVLGAAFDITERKERDEHQRAVQRLEVVGQLTAGIAHNFNNLLMGLLPNLELAARRAPADLVPLLLDAEQSGRRAAHLVRQLMTYAGRNHTASRRIERIGLLAQRTVAFCRTTFDRRIEIELRCDDHTMVLVDPTQLEQALLNLLINARDALEGATLEAPKIAVVSETMTPGAPELEGRGGSWVCIRVSDNGAGMDAGTMQRIWEPFFTTKAVGKGTGLGLATTQSIVREHGGFITCRSALGRGATLAIYLPEASPGVPADKTSASPIVAHPQTVVPATVLVVDDEDAIRNVVTRILRSAGFEVEAFTSGEEALERLADPSLAARISIALLDVSMPGMSGPDLRVRLRDLLPRAPVVFLTGYPYHPNEGDTVLEKPLTSDKLVSTLRELSVKGP